MTSLAKIKRADKASALSLDNLSKYLASKGMTLDADFAPEQFSAGFGNLNFLIRVDSVQYVLRRPPTGPIPPGANDMAREHRILSQLNPVFPLVPKARHLCEDVGVLGAPFQLMEYRPGLVIGASMPAEVVQSWSGDQAVGAFIGGNMIDVLARLHSVDFKTCGLDGLGKPGGFLARTVRGWNKRADLSWGAEAPDDLIAVMRWLDANLPAETNTPTLIHNDFKLDNIILDPQTLNPRTLIDWDMGTIGDPLYDLAVLLSYWTEPADHEAMRALGQMPTAQYGFPTREEAAQLYAKASGRDLGDFTFYRVLATVRLAVVFQQLFRRGQISNESSDKFAKFDELARGLLNFAHQISINRAL